MNGNRHKLKQNLHNESELKNICCAKPAVSSCWAGTRNLLLKRGRKSRSTALAWSMAAALDSLSSLTSWHWKVPAVSYTRPLACGERAKICSMPNSPLAPVNWVGHTGG